MTEAKNVDFRVLILLSVRDRRGSILFVVVVVKALPATAKRNIYRFMARIAFYENQAFFFNQNWQQHFCATLLHINESFKTKSN